MKNLPAVSSDWNEGRYFDLWMLVHFLSGAAGGFVNVFFGLTTLQVVLLGLAMMVAWEVGELSIGVFESPLNRSIDVGVGVLGTILALWIASHLSPMEQHVVFVVTLGTAITGMAFGVRNFTRRKRAGRAKPR